jgi:hypothetical protein
LSSRNWSAEAFGGLGEPDGERLREQIVRDWGSSRMATRGRLVDVAALLGSSLSTMASKIELELPTEEWLTLIDRHRWPS